MSVPSLDRKAREIRSRAAIRGWEYRQRHHAKGTWQRLRRLLAETRECWEVSEQVAEQLLCEGVRPAPVGHELEPPKQIFVLSAARIAQVSERRPIRVGLSSELLAARCLVLLLFPRGAE